MSGAAIERVWGREILDSRGRPTVEAEVVLASGAVGRAATPSGASTGAHEAHELRDGDPMRYRGLGVRNAVEHVRTTISQALRGLDPADQAAIDRRLIDLDGTPDRHVLGANALVAVSLATARAGALARGVELYRHIADLSGTASPRIPLPTFNMISGGLHAGRQIDIQDVLAIPLGAGTFDEALETAVEVHARIGDRLRAAGHPPLVGDEGGWAPPLPSNEAAVAMVAEAAASVGSEVVIGLDVASTHFLGDDERYALPSEGRTGLSAADLVAILRDWTARFPIASIEDGLAEDDWAGWRLLHDALADRVQLIGDDLFVTNVARVRRGIQEGVANAVLVKVNQAGTLTEALDVVVAARAAGMAVDVSARSGETEDAFLADLATGVAADQIKVGSVTRSSRLAKWNQLLRLQEVLGPEAYAGRQGLRAYRGAGAAASAGRTESHA